MKKNNYLTLLCVLLLFTSFLAGCDREKRYLPEKLEVVLTDESGKQTVIFTPEDLYDSSYDTINPSPNPPTKQMFLNYTNNIISLPSGKVYADGKQLSEKDYKVQVEAILAYDSLHKSQISPLFSGLLERGTYHVKYSVVYYDRNVRIAHYFLEIIIS